MKNDIYKALFKYSKTVHMSHFSTAPGCNNELKKKKELLKKTRMYSLSLSTGKWFFTWLAELKREIHLLSLMLVFVEHF